MWVGVQARALLWVLGMCRCLWHFFSSPLLFFKSFQHRCAAGSKGGTNGIWLSCCNLSGMCHVHVPPRRSGALHLYQVYVVSSLKEKIHRLEAQLFMLGCIWDQEDSLDKSYEKLVQEPKGNGEKWQHMTTQIKKCPQN